MIRRWLVTEPVGSRCGCVVALPGRGGPAEMMEHLCDYAGLANSLRICLEPFNYMWYPQPNGANDQAAAVGGLRQARKEIFHLLRKIQAMWRLKREEIALIGHSAGAVVSLDVVTHATRPFAAVVAIAGAILTPDAVPKAANKTPILLRHNMDDWCFEWYERYLPMKQALRQNGYALSVAEMLKGGHGVSRDDARLAGRFVGTRLGYDLDEIVELQE